jgi:hypothetical protein
MGFLILDARTHKACFIRWLFIATLTVCPQFTFLYSFEIDIDFPSCFGVKGGVEHADVQLDYYVSRSGLHKDWRLNINTCHICRDILALARLSAFFHTPPNFTPNIGGRWLHFRMRFFRLMSRWIEHILLHDYHTFTYSHHDDSNRFRTPNEGSSSYAVQIGC